MLKPQRHQAILDLVRRRDAVTSRELADSFRVTTQTIRRDIEDLAGQGKVARVFGGARMPAHARSTTASAIGQRAAAFVQPGQSVGIAGGVLAAAVARAIAQVEATTIVTNDIRVFHAVGVCVLVGGSRTAGGLYAGPLAVQTLAAMHLDVAFLVPFGIDRRAGITCNDLLEAEAYQAMHRAARQTVVIAGSSAVNRIGLRSIAPLTDIAATLVEQ